MFRSIFSPKIIPIARIFDEHERLHPFASVLYWTYIQHLGDLAFGSSLYIRYNTVAHVVNST